MKIASTERQKDVEKLRKNYKYYQDKLLQITRRNRSVLLKRIYNKHNFDLGRAEEITPDVLERIVTKTLKNISAAIDNKKDEGAISSILLDSTSGDDADSERSKLKMLSRNLKQIEEETGQQTGYFGFPFLQGHLNRDFYVRGPVVLFPISLEYRNLARGAGWYLRLLDQRPVFNGALISALKNKGGYSLPEDYEEKFDYLIEKISKTKKDLEQDFFNDVNEWIKDIVENIDESQNQFQTRRLESKSQDDINEMDEQRLHLANYKIIGSFPQADNEIHKDYDMLADRADALDIGAIGDLIDVAEPETDHYDSADPITDASQGKNIELNTVLPSDSSQDEVISMSKKDRAVVVRGPPGTGKSQVIVNLIADALTNNKKVLMVCQKRAALEVVRQRLEGVGLDKCAIFLEKEIDDREKMYQQLNDIIEKKPEAASASEVSIEEISAKIDDLVSWLGDFGAALHKGYFGGVTAHMLYARCNSRYRSVLDLSWLELEWKEVDEYINRIRNIENDYKKFQTTEHPWFGRKGFGSLETRNQMDIDGQLQKLIELSSSCVLAGNENDQSVLESQFDTYLNKPGPLKIFRRRAAGKIREILKDIKVTDEFVTENLDNVKNGIEFWRVFENILDIFEEDKQRELRSKLADTESLGSYLSSMQRSLDDFDRMRRFDRIRDQGGDDFKVLEMAVAKMNADENWSENIRQEIYWRWLNIIERENRILTEMDMDYESVRRNLGAYIEQKKEIVRRTIQRKIEGTISPDEIHGRNRTEEQKQWGALSAELKKKRKVKPIRKLFEEYSGELFRIAPCWLSSPEAVSKIFPLERNLFDLVIVDEASQLAVERAIPFMYRANHAVIAGDEKQLPPFDLFQIRGGEDNEDEEVYNEKSLLEQARVRCRRANLVWHYRSRYQDLIDFSNHAFYNGQLNVAPNFVKEPGQPPIRCIRCNGTWENNVNHVEANRVVEELGKIWSKRENKSVGVITFNERQQDLIQDIIDKKRDDDAEFSSLYAEANESKSTDEKLFVKNIENVQGDERDIIIFSVGYARTPDGGFGNRFGTLSMQGGENRLNVAVTRAKEEMVVISSMEPNLIKATGSKGNRMLHEFLRYAEAVDSQNKKEVQEVLSGLNPDMDRADQSGVEFDSEFEKQVHDRLEEKGYTVDMQIGQSGYRIDLAIVDPDDSTRYVLGIECDGATYHSAKDVKERDIMRQQFLEAKGWEIERVWSRNWWKDPGREIERIEKRISELVTQRKMM